MLYSIYLSIHTFYLSIYLSIHTFYLSIYLSIHTFYILQTNVISKTVKLA